MDLPAEKALRKLNQIVKICDWHIYADNFKVAVKDLDNQFTLFRASPEEFYACDTLNQPRCDLGLTVSTSPPEEIINWNADEINLSSDNQWSVEDSDC